MRATYSRQARLRRQAPCGEQLNFTEQHSLIFRRNSCLVLNMEWWTSLVSARALIFMLVSLSLIQVLTIFSLNNTSKHRSSSISPSSAINFKMQMRWNNAVQTEKRTFILVSNISKGSALLHQHHITLRTLWILKQPDGEKQSRYPWKYWTKQAIFLPQFYQPCFFSLTSNWVQAGTYFNCAGEYKCPSHQHYWRNCRTKKHPHL